MSEKNFNVCDNAVEWNKLVNAIQSKIEHYNCQERYKLLDDIEYEINYHDVEVFHRPINPRKLLDQLLFVCIQVYYENGNFIVTDNVEKVLEYRENDPVYVIKHQNSSGELIWECPIIKIMYCQHLNFN